MEWCGDMWMRDAASIQSGCEDRSFGNGFIAPFVFLKGGFKHVIISSLTTWLSTYLNLFKVKGREPQHWSGFHNHDFSEEVGFTHSFMSFFFKIFDFQRKGRWCKFMHLFFYLESCARPPNSHHLAQDFAMNQFCSMTWMSESMSLTCLMSTLSCLILQPSQICCAMEFYTTMVAFTWMRIFWPKSQQLSTNGTLVEVCTWSISTNHGSHTWHVFQLESLPVHGPIFSKSPV